MSLTSVGGIRNVHFRALRFSASSLLLVLFHFRYFFSFPLFPSILFMSVVYYLGYINFYHSFFLFVFFIVGFISFCVVFLFLCVFVCHLFLFFCWFSRHPFHSFSALCVYFFLSHHSSFLVYIPSFLSFFPSHFVHC